MVYPMHIPIKSYILDLCNSILDLYRHPNVGDRSIDLIGLLINFRANISKNHSVKT